jgi:hypothetical protein
LFPEQATTFPATDVEASKAKKYFARRQIFLLSENAYNPTLPRTGGP